MHAGDGLRLELRHVLVDHNEALFCEHRAIGEPKPVDIALSSSLPGTQVPNSGGQSAEGDRAFPAEEMQILVLVGLPDFVAH